MLILGITGGTGCGKTTLLRRAAALGGWTVDCDMVYHALLEQDPTLPAMLETRFPGVVEQGVLNRRKLGRLVFGDSAALSDLNAIVHPFVCAEVRQQLAQAGAAGCALAAVDAIALYESGLAALCRETVAVTAPPAVRAVRLMAREGISEDYARLRIAAQPDDAVFAARCSRVLVNDYPAEAQFAAACDRFLLALLAEYQNESTENQEESQHE